MQPRTPIFRGPANFNSDAEAQELDLADTNVETVGAGKEQSNTTSRTSAPDVAIMPEEARRHVRSMFKGVLATSYFNSPLRFVSDEERQKHRASLLSLDAFDAGHARMRAKSRRAQARVVYRRGTLFACHGAVPIDPFMLSQGQERR